MLYTRLVYGIKNFFQPHRTIQVDFQTKYKFKKVPVSHKLLKILLNTLQSGTIGLGHEHRYPATDAFVFLLQIRVHKPY